MLSLPIGGAIAGAERIRLAQICAAAQGVHGCIYDASVARLAQA